MGASKETDRRPRVLAKPVSFRGVLRSAGETIELREHEIARLEAEGCLEPEAEKPAGTGKGGAK